MGAVAYLLNMTGYERDTTVGILGGAVANLIFNFAFVPSFGINGAAFSAASSIVIWNVLLVRSVRKRLGLKIGLSWRL
jgi:O-antigen/teichoic acid export membrane protein